jgi:hypothetical protein
MGSQRENTPGTSTLPGKGIKMLATRHARVIGMAETMARATFTDILPSGDNWTDEVANLRDEFATLRKIESTRFESLRADIRIWQERVTAGEIDFDQAKEDDFKGALRALVDLEKFLIERFDVYNKKGLILTVPRLVAIMQAHQQHAESILDAWKSPEWETTDERVVKWDKEQTSHLRKRLASCE